MEPSSTHIEPFRFLDLPVEIRLIVYDQFKVVFHHYQIPIISHTITLANPSIPIRLLQTCRQINREATPIFLRNAAALRSQPPVLCIQARDLAGVLCFRSGFRQESNLLDKFCIAVKDERLLRAVHRYRAGSKDVAYLRKHFTWADMLSDAHIRAFSTFLLRAHMFRRIHAPIQIIVSMPAISPWTHIITVLRPVRYLWERLTLQNTPRTAYHQVDDIWLVRQFAKRIALCICRHGSMPVELILRLSDPIWKYRDAALVERQFQRAVDRAVLTLPLASRWRDESILTYGGLWKGDEKRGAHLRA